MNSLKKGEGVSLLNFEGGPGILLLNFEGGPGVPLLNFRWVPGPTFKLWGGSRGPGPTFTPCRFHSLSTFIFITTDLLPAKRAQNNEYKQT